MGPAGKANVTDVAPTDVAWNDAGASSRDRGTVKVGATSPTLSTFPLASSAVMLRLLVLTTL